MMSANSKKVIIYTTPTCVYCKMTKDFFAKHSVAYEEKNVIGDRAALDEMVKKSHQMGVPVIDIGGEIFVGFDRQGISKALGISH
jgi:glutaredoxin-like YruB-family protein